MRVVDPDYRRIWWNIVKSKSLIHRSSNTEAQQAEMTNKEQDSFFTFAKFFFFKPYLSFHFYSSRWTAPSNMRLQSYTWLNTTHRLLMLCICWKCQQSTANNSSSIMVLTTHQPWHRSSNDGSQVEQKCDWSTTNWVSWIICTLNIHGRCWTTHLMRFYMITTFS